MNKAKIVVALVTGMVAGLMLSLSPDAGAGGYPPSANPILGPTTTLPVTPTNYYGVVRYVPDAGFYQSQGDGGWIAASNTGGGGGGSVTFPILVDGGGTGDTSLTANAPLFGGVNGTSPVQSGTVGSFGQFLGANPDGGIPQWETPSGGPCTTTASVTITDAGQVLPSTACTVYITSAPSGTTTLTSATPIAAGSANGQPITIIDASHNVFIPNGFGGPNNVSTANQIGTALTGGIGTTFVWDSSLSAWISPESYGNGNITSDALASSLTISELGLARTDSTISGVSSTIPSTTSQIVITSAPSGTTTLTSTPPIASGGKDGDIINLENISGNTVVVPVGSGVNSNNGASITLKNNRAYQFVYKQPQSTWFAIGAVIDLAVDVGATILSVANGGTGTTKLSDTCTVSGIGTTCTAAGFSSTCKCFATPQTAVSVAYGIVNNGSGTCTLTEVASVDLTFNVGCL